MKAITSFRVSMLIGLFGLMGGFLEARAADFAPASLAGSVYTVTVQSGYAPFTSSGKYRLFLSTLGSNYFVLGNAGSGFSSGTYVYTKTGTNTGAVTCTDTHTGPVISLQLTFSGAATGIVALSAGAGSQNGAFAATNYASLGAYSLVVPGVSNNQFQAYVGGQQGFAYSVQASTNLLAWSAVTNLALSDISAPFSDAASPARHFYRAKAISTQFAPTSLTNVTFNFTITEGRAPLATNGVWQWLTGSNDNSYQIIGAPASTTAAALTLT